MPGASIREDRRNRFRGALLGLAAGDALGTTVEFRRPGTFEPLTDIVGGGPFDLPAGAWTDDTSMALCLAESLVQTQRFDPVDQLTRYRRWYREGHWSSTGRCFDIGVATRAAIERFERTGEPFPGDADREAGGNGPLMKLAPVCMAFAWAAPATLDDACAQCARTTHGLPQAIDATRYFGALLASALRGELKDRVLDQPADGLHPEIGEVAGGSFKRRQPPLIRGTGYAVASLEAALWALHTTRDFEAGALAAVNLGDDADTTAAIYGQLAGALYGADAIPDGWRALLAEHDALLAFADALLEIAEQS